MKINKENCPAKNIYRERDRKLDKQTKKKDGRKGTLILKDKHLKFSR